MLWVRNAGLYSGQYPAAQLPPEYSEDAVTGVSTIFLSSGLLI